MFESVPFIHGVSSWIARLVRDSGANGVVVGLSGGLDSAVVASLCVRALGAGRVHVLWMPCESSLLDQNHAEKVANELGLKLKFVDIGSAFRDLYEKVTGLRDGPPRSIGRQNLKSRLRMAALYCYANCLNLLVAGTGDKSEEEVGFFTKYGDGGVDFLPIGDVLKTEVRQLARDLHDIPCAVIEKPSSPGLYEGQTAEGDLGLTYEQVDAVLSEKDNSGPVFDKVKDLHNRSAHKRTVPPVFTF